MRFFRWLPLLLAVSLAACGSDDKKTEATATPAGSSASATPETDATGCRKVSAPKSKGEPNLPKPTLRLSPAKRYTATVKTSCGEFAIALDVKRAPKTTASFVSLARKKFFDNTSFHRIIAGFVIQGGDPLGDGTGGPGYKVVEPPPKAIQYSRGVVAMAKAADEPVGASGSQFYVVTGEDTGLPPQYALLGRISAGQDVVDAISSVPTNGETPVKPVVVDSITISEK